MRRALPTGLCLILSIFSVAAGIEPPSEENSTMPSRTQPLTVTVLFDNRPAAGTLETAWGFACLIEGLGKTILFDTGADGPMLLRNLAALDIVPQAIDAVVISHAHHDHAGGLAAFLAEHGGVNVYLLASFPDELAETARAHGAEVITVSDAHEICPGAMLTGALVGASAIPEQALIISTANSAALVTGCAHPGIVAMVDRARELSGLGVRATIGGFHLFREGDGALGEVITHLQGRGVRWIAPCHCSGDAAIGHFAAAFGNAFLPCGAGAVIPLGDLLHSPHDRNPTSH
jgi:7,8-dihydropterin-6-yl-methyl-4-(beta-D-ribofuranosyl)aminobenzene 5'-phosphate synthase